MLRVFAALRALAWSTGFIVLWGWLALQIREPAGGTLPAATRPVGTVCMVLGGALALWCISLFVVVGRGTPAPFDPPQQFVPTGPYRWVRNPMYVGGLLVLIGFSLWHHSTAMLLFAAAIAVVLHVFVLVYEEPSLRRRFGGAYEDYRTRIPRWLPRMPRT